LEVSGNIRLKRRGRETEGVRDGDTREKKQKDMPAYMHVCMCLSSVVGVCEMWVGPRTNCDA